MDESCGKCTPCRIGTKRLYEILDRITKGEGTLEDLDRLLGDVYAAARETEEILEKEHSL